MDVPEVSFQITPLSIVTLQQLEIILILIQHITKQKRNAGLHELFAQ